MVKEYLSPWIILMLLAIIVTSVLNAVLVVIIPSMLMNNLIVYDNLQAFMLHSYKLVLLEVVVYTTVSLLSNEKMSFIAFRRDIVMKKIAIKVMNIEYKYYLNDESRWNISLYQGYMFNSEFGIIELIFTITGTIISILTILIYTIVMKTVSLWSIPLIILFVAFSVIPSAILSTKVYALDRKKRKYELQAEYYYNTLIMYKQKQNIVVHNLHETINAKYVEAAKQVLKFENEMNTLNVIQRMSNTLIKYIFMATFLGFVMSGLTEVILLSAIWLIINLVEQITNFSNDITQMIYVCFRDYKKWKNNNWVNTLESVEYSDKIIEINKIEFRDVCFKYDEKSVLSNCSFTIEKGKKYAIIGRNGCGKSTIVNLILGFLEPCGGQILINDKLIDEFEKSQLRSSIATVFQELNIFPGTLKENIEMKVSYEESNIEHLNEHGLLSKYLNNSDIELTKMIFEEGIELSGGEIQQLGILRAIVKNRDVCIFDEPTANLDPINEEKYYHLFAEKFLNKTLIMITHRMAACKLVDQIIFIEDGQVVEQGEHYKLLAANGRYARFYLTQAKEFGEVNYE